MHCHRAERPRLNDLHVEVDGEGPTLVMLHGWGLNLKVFDRLVARLQGYHVVRIDLAGHGRSAWKPEAASFAAQAAEVAAIVRAHGERCAVLGWSMGGQIALELSASEPVLAERLVLIAATPRFTASDDWPHGMTSDVLRSFASRLELDWRRTVSEFFELQVRGSEDAAAILHELQSALTAHGEAQPEALAAGLANLAQADLRPQLRDVRQSALVIAGQYDRITRPAAARALAAALPGARYLEVRRAAHAPFLSHTDEVVRAIREFLA